MKVLITGGAGFLGLALARRLLALGRLSGPDGKSRPIEAIELLDIAVPPIRPAGLDDRVRLTAGAVTDAALFARLLDRLDIGIFHFASVVSGEGELNFDLAMEVNLTGNLRLLEASRRLGSRPRLVFASSIAVFGGDLPARVGDDTKQTPQTTYGTTKAIGELLVNDFSRKGFIDGRAARLPTVIIRPGKPNKAASSFASGVFREPLAGLPCVLPVGLDTTMPVIGCRTAVEGLIRLYEAPPEALGADRAVSLPALDVTVGEMVTSLERVAAGRPLGAITVARDPAIEAIVRTWPRGSKADRALALGCPQDTGLEPIIRAYVEDYSPAMPSPATHRV